MSANLLLAVAGVAILLFWIVGAYNRLVSLRTAIGAAWAQFEEPLQRREQALMPLIQRLREPLAAEHSALDAVVGALAQVRASAESVRARPVQVAGLTTFCVQESQLGGALARVMALAEQTSAWRDDAEVASQVAQAQGTAERLGAARHWFNDAAQAYDAAIRQWPTRALVPWFGFGPAGRL